MNRGVAHTDRPRLRRAQTRLDLFKPWLLVSVAAWAPAFHLGSNAHAGPAFETVALTGDQAPGADPGVVFDGFTSLSLNAAGQAAFNAFLTGASVDPTNDFGIYLENQDGVITQIAREGDQVPGADVGVVFGSLNGTAGSAFNASGQIAFATLLVGTGVDGTNNSAIYATNLDGELIEIARAGDLFDVDDDPLVEDLRTIGLLSLVPLSNNENGRPSSFNDLGELVFRATFTDGSQGVFVSNLVAVPEPGSLLMLALATLATCPRRRHGTDKTC